MWENMPTSKKKIVDPELSRSLLQYQKELIELKELAHRALELLENDPRYIQVERKIKKVYIDDEPKHVTWYSHTKFHGGLEPKIIKEEEKIVKELIENPDKETVQQWLAEARPVAERLKVLLSLFPVKIERKGFQRFVASDGTIEDYDWCKFEYGQFFGVLEISIPQFYQLRYFIRSVLTSSPP
jgi:hypothetical protein